MATIARTHDMFIRTTEAQTGTDTRSGLDTLVRFVARILTPDWVLALGDELAEKYGTRDQD